MPLLAGSRSASCLALRLGAFSSLGEDGHAYNPESLYTGAPRDRIHIRIPRSGSKEDSKKHLMFMWGPSVGIALSSRSMPSRLAVDSESRSFEHSVQAGFRSWSRAQPYHSSLQDHPHHGLTFRSVMTAYHTPRPDSEYLLRFSTLCPLLSLLPFPGSEAGYKEARGSAADPTGSRRELDGRHWALIRIMCAVMLIACQNAQLVSCLFYYHEA